MKEQPNECDFDKIAERQFVCRFCRRVVNTIKDWQPEQVHALCKVPQLGPGTELKYLIGLLGFSIGGCDCASTVKKMNRWGVEGCREHLDWIVEKLEANAKLESLWALGKAAAKATAMGIFSIRQLVERAIEAAEAKSFN